MKRKIKPDWFFIELAIIILLVGFGGYWIGGAACAQSMVADYPRVGTEVEESPKVRVMAGTIFGLNMTNFHVGSTSVAGSGVNPGVNVVFHSLESGGFYLGLRGGYTTASVLLPDETSVRRSAWFGMVDLGVSVMDYLAGGVSVGYHSSDLGYRSSPTFRLFGQFKYPLENTELIWLNIHSDLGVMLNDMYAGTRRHPMAGTASVGVICRIR